MKRYLKKIKRALPVLCVSAILILLTGCVRESAQTDAQNGEQEKSLLETPAFAITTEDQRTEAAEDLRPVSAPESGTVEITEGGDYLLKDLNAEKIVVDAEEQIVHLFFDNVTLDPPAGSALEVKNAGKVVITLADGSESFLRDSGRVEAGSEEDACVYSEADITVNGSGKLTVYGFYKDAVHVKGKIKLLGGDYYFKAKRSGLRGTKGVFIDAGEMTFETEKEGILTKKTGDDAKGTVQIMGGNIRMVCGRSCISSAHDILISGCRIYGKGVPGLAECDGKYIAGEGCIDE